MKTVSIYKLIAYSLDFEGYLRVRKTSQRSTGSQTFLTNIYIGNTERELLEQFKYDVGFGEIDNGYIPDLKSSRLYTWYMNREETLKHLPKIIPYLTTKWRQGELVLEAIKIIKPIEYIYTLTFYEKRELYTYDEILILNNIYWECKKLNERFKHKHSELEIAMVKLGLGNR
jgi:hypothetical protein